VNTFKGFNEDSAAGEIVSSEILVPGKQLTLDIEAEELSNDIGGRKKKS
jgi:hypothetical protein